MVDKSFFFFCTSGLVGLAAFAYYVAHLADEALTDDAKRRLVSSIETARPSALLHSGAQAFLRATDFWYGGRLVSLRAFSMSVLLSCASLVFLVLVGHLTYGLVAPDILRYTERASIVRNLLVLLPAMLLIDFLVAVITRSGLRVVSELATVTSYCVMVASVLLAASYLFFVGLGAAERLMLEVPGDSSRSFVKAVSSWIVNPSMRAIVEYEPGRNGLQDLTVMRDSAGRSTIVGFRKIFLVPESLLFYSAMVPTLWMLLHMPQFLLFRLLLGIELLRDRALALVKYKEHPGHALALLLVLSATAFFTLLALASIAT